LAPLEKLNIVAMPVQDAMDLAYFLALGGHPKPAIGGRLKPGHRR